MLYTLNEEEFKQLKSTNVTLQVENKKLSKKLKNFLDALEVVTERSGPDALEAIQFEKDVLKLMECIKTLVKELDIPVKDSQQIKLL